MDLKSAEKLRKELSAKLVRACDQIARERQPFEPVMGQLYLDFPEREQVPADDLMSLYEDLKSAAELESVLQGLMDEEHLVYSLHRWNHLRKQPIRLLTEPPEFLMDADPQLANELKERILDLQKKAHQASSGSIQELARQVDRETQAELHSFDPYTLLGKYWQLYWCLVSDMIVDTSTETSALYAIGKAQKFPRLLASQLAQKFESINTTDDLLAVEKYLGALRFFNRGLVAMPEINDEGEPLHDLPPLPAGQTYPDVEPELDEDALEGWHRTVINWLTIFGNAGDRAAQDKDLKSAAQDSKKVNEDLEYLGKSVWPMLKLPLWRPESPLGILGSEAYLLQNLGAAMDEGGLDWANMKSMEIISYLEDQVKKLGLEDEAGSRVPGFFMPYHTTLLDATADLRGRALERIDRQVINILRDRTRAVKRLQDELLKKPQTDETAIYVYQAITRTAEEIVQDDIQSGQRKDAAAVWKLIREATRPWSGLRRGSPDLPPKANRLWRKLYRQATLNASKVRFVRRRRETLLATSLVAAIVLVALGYVGLRAIQAAQQAEIGPASLGTSTLNLPATMRFETAAARETESIATSTAFALAVQASRAARESTATAVVENQILATREENLARAGTATAQEIAYETAVRQAILDQTATATAQIYIQRATYEAILCRNNPSFLNYDLSPTPQLSPAPGTRYNVGTQDFTVTASWTITNTSECRWGYLSLEPASGEEEYGITYNFRRSNGEEFDLSPENTIAVSETIQLVAEFDPLQAYNVVEEWVLVINNQALPDSPHVDINIRNWVIPVYPPTRTPTPEEEDDF